MEVSKNLWEFWILFEYFPFISDAVSKIPGGLRHQGMVDGASEVNGEYPKSIQNSHTFLDTPTEIGGGVFKNIKFFCLLGWPRPVVAKFARPASCRTKLLRPRASAPHVRAGGF